MKRPHSYLFTSRQNSTAALVSVILGSVSAASTCLMIYKTYENGGRAQLRYGAVAFVCLIFALAGLILAILSRREPDRIYFFSYLGMALNGFVVVMCFVFMYLGL